MTPTTARTRSGGTKCPEFCPKAKRALSELHLAPWGLDVPHKATSVT